MILMKKVFFDAIRDGRKRQTLRFWRRAMARPGQLHTIPGLGKVLIEETSIVSLEELSEADAAADGFASLAQLRAALEEMYTDEQRSQRKLYRVRFAFPAPARPRATGRRSNHSGA